MNPQNQPIKAVEELADEIHILYMEASDNECTCGSNPEGHCDYCSDWEKARKEALKLIGESVSAAQAEIEHLRKFNNLADTIQTKDLKDRLKAAQSKADFLTEYAAELQEYFDSKYANIGDELRAILNPPAKKIKFVSPEEAARMGYEEVTGKKLPTPPAKKK